MSGLKKRVEYLIKHSPLVQVLYRKGIYILLRVQSLRMHVIHMLFVPIIAAGLIANEWRSMAFSQKIRLKAPVCAAFSVIELA